MKRPDAIETQIAEWKAAIKEIRATEFVDGKDEYKAKLLSDARQHLAMLRALKKPTPPSTNTLVAAVAKSLHFSLRSVGPIDPTLLKFAAVQAVKLLNEQKRDAVIKRHSKPEGARSKAAKLTAIWQGSTVEQYATKAACAEDAERTVGLKFDAAIKALRNVARKKVSTRR
jgi:hypothetical protein